MEKKTRTLDELKKAKELLEQANIMASRSMSSNKEIQEARFNIKKAINNIEIACEKHESKKISNAGQFEQWWGNIQSGVSISGISRQSQVNSLSNLNKMIVQEQNKLDDLEKLMPP